VLKPEWLRDWVPSDWYNRYGRVIDEYRLPNKQPQRTASIEQIGSDGMMLLERLWQEERHTSLRLFAPVEQLRQRWVQNVYLDNGIVKLRSPTEIVMGDRTAFGRVLGLFWVYG